MSSRKVRLNRAVWDSRVGTSGVIPNVPSAARRRIGLTSSAALATVPASLGARSAGGVCDGLSQAAALYLLRLLVSPKIVRLGETF